MKALTNDEYMFYDRELHTAINECRRLAKFFKNNKAAACLRRVDCKQKPRLPVETRWSSNHSCVKFVHDNISFLHKAIALDDCPKLKPTIGNNIQNFKSVLSSANTKLSKLNSITLYLQTAKLKLSQAVNCITTGTQLFKKDIDKILVDETYFNGGNAVVQDSHNYISAVVKIQSGNCLHLSKDEEATVENLLKNQDKRKDEGEKRK